MRLMRPLGLQAIYRKPRTTVANPDHRVYPYLLRGLTIVRPNHAWCADMSYIRCQADSCTWWRSWTGRPGGAGVAAEQHCSSTRPAIGGDSYAKQIISNLESGGVSVDWDGFYTTHRLRIRCSTVTTQPSEFVFYISECLKHLLGVINRDVF